MSQMFSHEDAKEREATCLSAERDGGIRQAFSAQFVLHRKGLVGALKVLMYYKMCKSH